MVAEKTFKPYVFSTVAFVAVLCALVPYTLVRVQFVVKEEIFIAAPPEEVFAFLSDVRLLDHVHPYRIEARDIQHFSDLELNYTSVERVDYVKGVYSAVYAFPVWVRFAKIKNGYQVRSTYDVLNGTLIARQAFTITAAKHAGHNGTMLTDKNLMECPWVYSYATFWKAKEAHRDILEGMKQLLEREQVYELNLPNRYLTGSDVTSRYIPCVTNQ
ncbi:Hypp8950 [Branchiostoma lanceolatum]|uniref:Hypp8950 protein n=1 Tax=Branchiostoma lanceolatum TaxID=7740 RepID=A0A8J9ZAL9_BRALA|nr:Hypp8950 [Branchiostoma lanceolatum]